MDLTLVPFGYSLSQDELVDVHQVSSGKRCGCECPSCHAPLIARKGSKKVWHFAHDSKSRTENRIEKCRYSFYVSVRMMARQLIGNRLSIRLPPCEVVLSERVPTSGKRIQVSEVVTESREIVLKEVILDTTLGSNKVDLAGKIDGYCLAVVFTHPGRDDFSHFARLQQQRSGVVAISLTALNSRFTGFDASRTSYKKILENFISQDTSSKSWIFHPRLFMAEQQARAKLSKAVSEAENNPVKRNTEIRCEPEFDARLFDKTYTRTPNLEQGRRFSFTCRLCNSSWSGVGTKAASCRKCGTSLLVSRQEDPESKA